MSDAGHGEVAAAGGARGLAGGALVGEAGEPQRLGARGEVGVCVQRLAVEVEAEGGRGRGSGCGGGGGVDAPGAPPEHGAVDYAAAGAGTG